jgi:hypothetical protein
LQRSAELEAANRGTTLLFKNVTNCGIPGAGELVAPGRDEHWFIPKARAEEAFARDRPPVLRPGLPAQALGAER